MEDILRCIVIISLLIILEFVLLGMAISTTKAADIFGMLAAAAAILKCYYTCKLGVIVYRKL